MEDRRAPVHVAKVSNKESDLDLAEADLTAILLPMADRFQEKQRGTTDFADLAAQDTVAGLLRAACRQMEPPITELERTLRDELHVPVGPELREGLLGVAYLKKILAAQFRQQTHVGCVDRAVQKVVGLVTLGAALSPEQWRTASRAVRNADLAVVLIAMNVEDLLDTRFGFSRGGVVQAGKSTSSERYALLLGLPLAVRRGLSSGENIDFASSFEVFQRLAERL